LIKELVDQYRRLVHHKAYAYNQVFHRKSPHAQTVLRDLARFCRAHHTTFLPDPRAHAVLEGRREVWLKIQEYLQMTPDELYELHKIRETSPRVAIND
jgi:hypothetical protein